MEQLEKYQLSGLKFKHQCIDAPHNVVMEVYDQGIQACGERDDLKARNVIKTLIGYLNFEYEDVALGLYRLYDNCLTLLNSQKFNETGNILKELNKYWNDAVDVNLSEKQKPEPVNDGSTVVSDVYLRGIRACDENDATKAIKVLRVLMNALDFKYEEVASGFYRLYEYCLQMVNARKFDEAKAVLVEINQTWNKAVASKIDEAVV